MKIIDYCPVCGSYNVNWMTGILAPFIGYRIFGWMPTRIQQPDKKNGEKVKDILAISVCKTMICGQENCGFSFMDIRFDDSEMGRLYASYRDETYVKQREMFEAGYGELNDKLDNQSSENYDDMEQFILTSLNGQRPKKVLDWGGNNGINTPFRDANIHIFDICDKKPLHGEIVSEPRPPYDLIVCSNVFEHISYPAALLRNITGSMDKGTKLYIEVPLESINKDVWMWHEHINKFSLVSLTRLIEVCGLRVINSILFDPPEHGYLGLLGMICQK